MARINVPSITPDADGTLMPAATTGDATNNHTVTNSGRTIILITNSGAVDRVATLEVDRKVQGQTVPSLTRTLTAGQRWIFGSLPVADFGRLLRLNVAHAELKIDVIEP
jgi:hypothetical protein